MSMVLETSFRVRGRECSLALDIATPVRCLNDENYAEWIVTADDGRVLEVTVWKLPDGSFSNDGIMEIFGNWSDYRNGLLQDKKSIKIKNQTNVYFSSKMSYNNSNI